MTKLNPQQEKFCNKYIECGNASEALRYAYSCKKHTDKSVWERSSTLLSSIKVQSRVKELQDELRAKSDITKERIMDELKVILNAKITDYLTFDGSKIVFKNFNSLTEAHIKAIESIKQGKYGIELKLHGKPWTIDRICKMLGLDTPTKHEHTGKDGESLFNDFSKEDLINIITDD